MNKPQKDNLAKYFYDISKLFLAGFVVANIISGKVSVFLIIAGLIVSIGFLIIGYIINQTE